MTGYSVTKYLDKDKYINQEELCELLRISRDLFYKMKKAGVKFETIQWGHGYYYNKPFLLKNGQMMIREYFESIKEVK